MTAKTEKPLIDGVLNEDGYALKKYLLKNGYTTTTTRNLMSQRHLDFRTTSSNASYASAKSLTASKSRALYILWARNRRLKSYTFRPTASAKRCGGKCLGSTKKRRN